MSLVNGKLQSLIDDVSDVKTKIDVVHEKVAGNQGIYDKAQSLKHLDKLPSMATTMKIQAYTNLFLAALIGLFVLAVLIKGSEMRISIPGWLEITGGK